MDAGGDASTDASTDAAVPPNPAWDCVGEPVAANVPIHVFARYRSFAGGVPLSGLTVTGCPTSSANCSPAVAGTPKDTGSDGLFEITMSLPVVGGFRGTLETAATGAFPKLLPSILAVKPGQTNTQSLEDAGADRPRYPTDLLTSDDLQGIADALGSSPKLQIVPDATHLVFTATNCQDELAAGVTVSSDFQNASTRLVYLDENGQPNKDLKQTSSSGRGIFLNLPVAQLTLTLTREDGQKAFNQSVPSRKGTISYTFLSPAR